MNSFNSRENLTDLDHFARDLLEDFRGGAYLGFHKLFAHRGIEASEIASDFLVGTPSQGGLQVSNHRDRVADLLGANIGSIVC